MSITVQPYRYLNAEARWPSAATTGLDTDAEGVLRLAALPGGATVIDAGAVSALAGPAAVGVAPDGTIYVVDPERHRVVRIDPCDGGRSDLPCLTGPGAGVGELDSPRGVVVGAHGRVYVADSGNGRVQVVDPRSGAVVAVIGGLRDARDLALDAVGNLYVVEAAPARLAKLDRSGRRDEAFRPALGAPLCVAVIAGADGEQLLVVEAEPAGPRLVVLALDGARDEQRSAALAALALDRIAAAAAHGNTLFVATPHGVVAFDFAGHALGVVAEGPASGIALDAHGRLLVHGARGTTVCGEGGRAASGRLLAGPIAQPAIGPWERARVLLAEPLPPGAHLRMWTLTQDAAGAAPPLPTAVPDAEPVELTPLGAWRAGPPDSTDLLVLNQPGRVLWLAVELSGEHGATAAIEDVRLDVIGGGRRDLLPAIYADEPGAELMRRFVALLGSPLEELDDRIDDLPLVLDPAAAPDRDPGDWLDRLAARLEMPLDAGWDSGTRRSLVATAFERHGRRGTPAGLREVIGRRAGAPVTITEPAANAWTWLLGEPAPLGLTSMLAAAPAEGSVLDVTATVDGSWLIAGEDLGSPLFGDLAHRFCVAVHRADLPRGGRPAVEDAVERERPAHTIGHVAVLEPRTLIGAQARIGIDLVVGPSARSGAPYAAVGGHVGATRVAHSNPDRGGQRDG